MTPPLPRLSLLDRLIEEFDRGLRTVAAANVTARPNPAGASPESVTDPAARRHAAALMRVNHAGEIAAQALYHGQALTARNPAVRRSLLEAARDETDHLAWCEQRVRELGDRTSLLAPVWYAGSFAIGALAGLAGDRTSLGFVAETERQVIEHLESHLHELPARRRALAAHRRADAGRRGPARLGGAHRRRPRAAAPGPGAHAAHREGHDRHRLPALKLAAAPAVLLNPGRLYINRRTGRMETGGRPLSEIPAINRFLSYCRIRTVPSKTVLIHAGDVPDVLYFVIKGSVEVLIEDEEGNEMVLAYLNKGQFFGEMGSSTSSRSAAPGCARARSASSPR